mmetsp:Transcript_5766/g.14320  ORF Transcript_5766/g.14320 Transcript_5766/m.14320 type:complete len:228 (+) Transcript_5766:256-939(+)
MHARSFWQLPYPHLTLARASSDQACTRHGNGCDGIDVVLSLVNLHLVHTLPAFHVPDAYVAIVVPREQHAAVLACWGHLHGNQLMQLLAGEHSEQRPVPQCQRVHLAHTIVLVSPAEEVLTHQDVAIRGPVQSMRGKHGASLPGGAPYQAVAQGRHKHPQLAVRIQGGNHGAIRGVGYQCDVWVIYPRLPEQPATLLYVAAFLAVAVCPTAASCFLCRWVWLVVKHD